MKILEIIVDGSVAHRCNDEKTAEDCREYWQNKGLKVEIKKVIK